TSSETFCCIVQSCASLQTHNGGAWTNPASPWTPCAATDASSEASIAQDDLVQLAGLNLSFPWSCFLMF
ncbi:unnamed protein product, partial [Musa textilis]